jgi:RimJ/RimL family protein N-acetyltransferase
LTTSRKTVRAAALTPQLHTDRLLLRGWRTEDREPFAQMGADAEAMRFYPAMLTRAEYDARVDQYEREWARDGFGKWAVEIPGVATFAGSIGLAVPAFEASFTPCVEIGWRLAREYWGRGYATEAARAAIEFGFTRIGLDEIVAFTVPANKRSVRVMEKLGMKYSGEFDHPAMKEGHPLRRHVLYRVQTHLSRGR